ncbi:pectinesterase family protein [Actinoallomurus sp. CA-150999]|uniref:pectinesterase family protein n=1 Tax=Actinoallomurus sp. CA-150999 TaxID=3239887 RepID=UPI003D8D1FC8
MRRTSPTATAATILAGSLLTVATRAAATSTVLTVDQNGAKGAYATVQAAVDAAPKNSRRPVTIVVGKGTYHEVVSVPADQPNLHLIGATGDPADVVITYDNSAGTPKPGGGTYGTEGSATVTIAANGFLADGITFENAFDEQAHASQDGHQAVALRTLADRISFYHSRFLGNQDTLYLDAANKTDIDRVYVRDSYVAGDVDFIFGPATAVFDHSTIDALDRGSTDTNGFITAASTQLANKHGFLFTGSTFVSNAKAKTFYLGRPWHHLGDPLAIAQVTVRDSSLAAHIKDQPWTDMAGWSWAAARFGEYHNTGPGAGVSLFRPQLTDAEAEAATPAGYLSGTDRWKPWTHHRADPHA